MKTGKGFHSTAEDQAKALGLTKTSGYRDPEKNAEVGGSPTSHHVTGKASDFAAPMTKEGKEKMRQYAEWAAKSGLFIEVIYGGKDWISGEKDDDHDDHVHVAWK